MNKHIEKIIVRPTAFSRKFDIEKEGPVVDGASRFEDPIDLSEYGYVEEEYLIRGTANVYNWPNTHLPPVIVNEDCPYCSRIVVIKP